MSILLRHFDSINTTILTRFLAMIFCILNWAPINSTRSLLLTRQTTFLLSQLTTCPLVSRTLTRLEPEAAELRRLARAAAAFAAGAASTPGGGAGEGEDAEGSCSESMLALLKTRKLGSI